MSGSRLVQARSAASAQGGPARDSADAATASRTPRGTPRIHYAMAVVSLRPGDPCGCEPARLLSRRQPADGGPTPARIVVAPILAREGVGSLRAAVAPRVVADSFRSRSARAVAAPSSVDLGLVIRVASGDLECTGCFASAHLPGRVGRPDSREPPSSRHQPPAGRGLRRPLPRKPLARRAGRSPR